MTGALNHRYIKAVQFILDSIYALVKRHVRYNFYILSISSVTNVPSIDAKSSRLYVGFTPSNRRSVPLCEVRLYRCTSPTFTTTHKNHHLWEAITTIYISGPNSQLLALYEPKEIRLIFPRVNHIATWSLLSRCNLSSCCFIS